MELRQLWPSKLLTGEKEDLLELNWIDFNIKVAHKRKRVIICLHGSETIFLSNHKLIKEKFLIAMNGGGLEFQLQ